MLRTVSSYWAFDSTGKRRKGTSRVERRAGDLVSCGLRLQTASGAAHLAEELVEHLEISCDSKSRLSELLATLFTSDPGGSLNLDYARASTEKAATATRCKEGEQKIEDTLEALEDWTVI